MIPWQGNAPDPAKTPCVPARKKALDLLVRMDRSRKGLYERLLQAGYTDEEAEDAVTYAEGFGYINDRRYAEAFIRHSLPGKGRGWILAALREKGVDRETAEAAFEEAVKEAGYDEAEQIRAAAARKYPEDLPEDWKEKRKLIAWLVRRGFSYEAVKEALFIE